MIVFDEELSWFMDVVVRWRHIHESFTQHWLHDEEGSFWHIERAQISVLAGAIWQMGGLVLEEFQSNKESETHGEWKGRTDMIFVLDGTERIVETKAYWPNLGADQNWDEDIDNSIDAALRDTKATLNGNKKQKIKEGLAIVFIGPHFLPREDLTVLHEFHETLSSKKHNIDLLAWYTAEKALLSPAKHEYRRLYMAVKRVPL